MSECHDMHDGENDDKTVESVKYTNMTCCYDTLSFHSQFQIELCQGQMMKNKSFFPFKSTENSLRRCFSLFI